MLPLTDSKPLTPVIKSLDQVIKSKGTLNIAFDDLSKLLEFRWYV